MNTLYLTGSVGFISVISRQRGYAQTTTATTTQPLWPHKVSLGVAFSDNISIREYIPTQISVISATYASHFLPKRASVFLSLHIFHFKN